MRQSSSKKSKMRFFARLISSLFKAEENRLAQDVLERTGIRPVRIDLYELAFRHSSALSFKKTSRNNQRLEFLGDAILGAVVADYLYHTYPEKDEGFLTGMRSKIVSRSSLNKLAEAMNLQSLIISKIDLRKPAKSLGGDTLEALIGAIYLDKGIKEAQRFITQKILHELIDVLDLEHQIISYKGLFIEWAQKQRKSFEFVLLESWGQQHHKTFKIGLYVNGKLLSSGVGLSKKQAEEVASELAFKELLVS